MKIKAKLMGMSLGTSIVPALLVGALVGYSAYQNSRQAIETQIERQLSSLTQVKQGEVEGYFKTIRDQVLTLASSAMTQEAMQAFSEGFQQHPTPTEVEHSGAQQALEAFYSNSFQPKLAERNKGAQVSNRQLLEGLSPVAMALQSIYVAHKAQPLSSLGSLGQQHADSAYAKAHERYHAIYDEYLQTFGYYDIFLVDDDSGDIVYSVFKEIDFATSLKNGPYADTGIAEAFRQSQGLPKGQSAIVDFAEYLPSFGYPASFIATPVYREGARLGTLIFQMPVERINNLINFNQAWDKIGLGQTGAVYLVAADGTLRNDYRHFLEDTEAFSQAWLAAGEPEALVQQMQAQQTTIGLMAAPSGSAKKALAGNTGLESAVGKHGQMLISAFAPLQIEGLSWAVVSQIEQSESLATVYDMRGVIILQICAVTLLCALAASGVAYVLANRFVQPIRRLADTITQVAQNGDFSVRVPESGSDEVGMASSAINRMLSDVQAALKQIDVVTKGMAEGDFSNRIETELRGDLGQLKDAVNSSVELAESSMQCIDEVLLGLSRGEFDLKEHSPLKGGYQRIVDNAHSTIEAIGGAMSEVIQVMRALSQGDFEQRVDKELPGDLDELKQRLNASLDTLASATSEVERVSQAQSQGDLSIRIDSDFEGTLSRLKDNSNRISDKLQSVIEQIQSSAHTVHQAADEISKGNSHLSQRTDEQASDLEKTAESMSDITSVVARNAERAQQASELTHEAKKAAEIGGNVAVSATQAMSEINESSRLMSDIIGAINEIAFQTNLLALNASVEAARAGEQGRGFSVVASEVRALAIRSAESANEIKRLIETNMSKIQHGSQLVEDSGQKLTEIVQSVQKVSSIVEDISSASHEQSESIESINASIRDMDENTQQNAALVQQMAAASESLSQQSEDLQTQLAYFKLS